jgi:hypothetical protein
VANILLKLLDCLAATAYNIHTRVGTETSVRFQDWTADLYSRVQDHFWKDEPTKEQIIRESEWTGLEEDSGEA